MLIDPISVGFGVASLGMGLGQSYANSQAQRQDYLNKQAFANANTEFAQWQAGFSARVRDANSQYGYWKETVNHNQQLGYANSLRNFELQKEITQLDVIQRTRASAGADYANQSQALQQQVQEKSMQDAIALQQMRMQMLRSSSAVQAMATEGRSVDRLVNDYARQEGNWTAIQQVNRQLYNRQVKRQQAAQVAQYLERWNSQPAYQKQQILDPVAPFPPLPTLIAPPSPSMRGGDPGGMSGLQVGSAVLGAAGTFMDWNSQLTAYRQGTAGK